jgi:serine protease inhibitor
MVQNGPFRVSHLQEIDAKALELPYKGNKLSLIIVRPNQIDGLRNIEKRLVQFLLVGV